MAKENGNHFKFWETKLKNTKTKKNDNEGKYNIKKSRKAMISKLEDAVTVNCTPPSSSSAWEFSISNNFEKVGAHQSEKSL